MNEDERRSRLEAVERELAYLAEERKTRTRHGVGEKLCVVVIDMQRFFVSEDDPAGKASLEANAALLDKARAKSVPTFLVKVVYDSEDEINPAQRARFLEFSRPLFRGEAPAEIQPILGPKGEDVVIEKKHASGFSGSRLKEAIDAAGCDTVLLTGTSTSGCVRATAVEGAALGLRMIVVEEATYERRPLSGPVALAELADRYADVVSLDEALAFVDAA